MTRCWGDEMAKVIKSETIAEPLDQMFSEYYRDSRERMKETTEQTGRECAKKLKSASPKRTGKYASGWGKENTTVTMGGPSTTVWNKKYPGLTHLLEYGHVNSNGTGRTPAHPHIKSVEQEMSEKYYQKMKECAEDK